MWKSSKQQAKIEELEHNLEQAKVYIQKEHQQQLQRQTAIEQWSGGSRFVLSQLEGEWEVPVRWAESPMGTSAVVTLQEIEEPGGAPALTVFALQSAFPERARLEDLGQSGWAVVRAWPMNLPGGAADLSGSANERYALCALTSMSLWEAGRESTTPPGPVRGNSSGSLEIRA